MKYLIAVPFFCLISAIAPAQDRGMIECQGKTSVPAWAEPGSLYVVKQVSCGETVSIIGLERGYVKVQIKQNVTAYIDAKYVRFIQTDSDTDRRVADLEAQTKTLQEKPSSLDNTSPREAAGSIEPTAQRFPRGSSQREKSSEPMARRVDVAGMLTYLRSFEPGAGMNFYGWNASLGGNLTEHFGLEANVGGSYFNTGTSFFGTWIHTVLGGPRIVFPGNRATPFVHFLAGLARGRAQFLGIGATINGLGLVPGFGLDVRINRRFDFRAFQADYMIFYADNTWAKRNVRVGGGLVAKF